MLVCRGLGLGESPIPLHGIHPVNPLGFQWVCYFSHFKWPWKHSPCSEGSTRLHVEFPTLWLQTDIQTRAACCRLIFLFCCSSNMKEKGNITKKNMPKWVIFSPSGERGGKRPGSDSNSEGKLVMFCYWAPEFSLDEGRALIESEFIASLLLF